MKNCEIKNVKCVDSITKPFKVGDKVYVGLTGRVAKVTEIIDTISTINIVFFTHYSPLPLPEEASTMLG